LYDRDHYYTLDFIIRNLNITIKFNDDVWHVNPKIYNENDSPNSFEIHIKTKELWNKDKIRIDFLKTKLTDIIIIWESELKKKGIEKISDELVEKIKTYIK
jgi:hypothetical protein